MIIVKPVFSKCFHLFLLLFGLCFFGLHSFNVYVESDQKNVPMNYYCSNKEFQCENGECVAKPFVCDGIPDCDDASDETYNLCRNITCREQYFQCDYGACISKKYQCDGRQQCPDGSDERREECDYLRGKKRTKRSSSKLCTVPSNSLDRSVVFDCRFNCDPSSGYVPNMTLAFVTCKPNFFPPSEVEEPPVWSMCVDGVWRPSLANCYKNCTKLNPINVGLKCTRNGIPIPCDEKSLLAGSKVRPYCKPLHRYANGVPPDYVEITCNENGKWDKRLFNCIPECGRSYMDIPSASCSRLMPRIGGGVQEKYGDSPWHVAIYNANRVLICGGTIIHPYIVLTAAHCFEVNETFNNNTRDYEVVVSKFTRNYIIQDNDCQKVHKIKEIRVSGKGYYGFSNSYTADIVALILEEKIIISSSVLPACVDWISLSGKTPLAENTFGKVSGWGMNGTDQEPFSRYSENLKTANLSFISHERCVKIVPDEFRRYVTFDKFCAGIENGPRVLQGDSGGGFLIPQTNNQRQTLYYLRGIVSVKEASVTPIAAFTDLADHYEWVLATRDEIDKRIVPTSRTTSRELSGEEICNNYNASNCVMVQHCPFAYRLESSKQAIYCGYDDENPEAERICCHVQMAPVKTSAEVVSSYCEDYAQCATDCVNDVPPPGKSSPALPKEYPHIAMIGCESNETNVYWYNVGSLISDRFVLSVPFSGCPNEMVKWVRLGGLIETHVDNKTYGKVYEIEESYIHPNYSFPRANIMLYKLKTPVKFNSYVRPACLYTSNFNLINSTLRVVGWGGYEIPGSKTQELHKGTVTVLDDQKCSKVDDHDPKSMTCAADVTDGEALCVAGKGSPLQILRESTSCMWRIYAIVIGYTTLPASCENFKNAEPLHFTKVSYYLDWIQSIVWP